MKYSASNTFNTIRSLVKQGLLDNERGFTPNEVRRLATQLNSNTVGTFLPKHCINPKIYFERNGAVYRIRKEWL